MMTLQHYGLALCTVLILTGCGTAKKQENTAPKPTINENAETSGVTDQDSLRGNQLNAGNTQQGGLAIPEVKTIYFDYDRSDVGMEARSILEQHAAFLSSRPDVAIRLEGHADERGSREYNLALGEQRANAVKRLLSILGVSEQQLTILSYGEEQPLDFSQNEAAWQRNRRVELVYP